MNTREKGFTLIELMIVIAIVGILAAIAIPKYQAHVRNADEKAMLVALQEQVAAMQRWKVKNKTYAGAMLDDGATALCNTTGVTFTYPKTGATLYSMECTLDADTARNQFVIVVNALDRQQKQLCTKLVMNQDGIVKSTSAASTKSNNAACDTLLK